MHALTWHPRIPHCLCWGCFGVCRFCRATGILPAPTPLFPLGHLVSSSRAFIGLCSGCEKAASADNTAYFPHSSTFTLTLFRLAASSVFSWAQWQRDRRIQMPNARMLWLLVQCLVFLLLLLKCLIIQLET